MIVKVKVYLGSCPKQVSQPNASQFQVKKARKKSNCCNSLLRGTEGPACQMDISHRSAAFLGLK